MAGHLAEIPKIPLTPFLDNQDNDWPSVQEENPEGICVRKCRQPFQESRSLHLAFSYLFVW